MEPDFITLTIGKQKTIALIAHDGKKAELIDWCKKHAKILSKHNLVGTGTTARMITARTGLTVKGYNSGPLGGDQQIGARIAYNEIDLVLFFVDPDNPTTKDADTLARLCDRHTVPFASNVATAEVLIQGLRRGDLDWRDIVNPKKK